MIVERGSEFDTFTPYKEWIKVLLPSGRRAFMSDIPAFSATHHRTRPGRPRKVGLTRRQLLPLLGVLATATAARANEDTIDMSHAVFVAMAGSERVCFIDPDTDRIAGFLNVGLVPHSVELASSISKLLATDGITNRVNIVDVVSGEIMTETLDFAPGRITVGPDGLTAALADPATGRLVLLDLLRRQKLGAFSGPAPLQDMLFSADGSTLFLSGGTSSAISAIDAGTARPAQPIETGLPPGTLALARSSDGRRLFVQSSSGAVGVVDLEHRHALAPIQAGADATVAFPSASGSYLLIANNQRGTLTVVRDTGEPLTTVFKAASGVSVVYTAWFESLALVPSATARALLIYDLDALKPAGSIPLAAAPERGGITPDGQKLYLPLPDAKTIAVFDARQRRLVASVSVPAPPAKVLLAGSYGVCH
jgi:DNA-binding beta-propeller fold protein YncE